MVVINKLYLFITIYNSIRICELTQNNFIFICYAIYMLAFSKLIIILYFSFKIIKTLLQTNRFNKTLSYKNVVYP